MPYCPECGKEIREGTKFCPDCGAEIEIDTDVSGDTPPRTSPSRSSFLNKKTVGAIGIAAVVLIGVFLFFSGIFSSNTYFDTFSDGDLSEYKVVEGEEDYWEVSQKIDGNSLHAKTNDSGGNTIVLDPDEYSWSGNRVIEVDFKCNDQYWKKNGMIVFYDDGLKWVARVGVQGDAVNLFNEEAGNLAKETVQVDDSGLHHLKIKIEGRTINVSLDGTTMISYEHDEEIGSGIAGLRTVGTIPHETWFDNFRVKSL